MLMIDKASGEIGTRIRHPLQAKFEQSLYRVLGEQSIGVLVTRSK